MELRVEEAEWKEWEGGRKGWIRADEGGGRRARELELELNSWTSAEEAGKAANER